MSQTSPLQNLRPTAPLREPARESRPLGPARVAPTADRQRRSPLAAALVSVGIVLGILAAQLGLSIAISQGAYEARALEIEQRDLTRVERVLGQTVGKLSSPQNLSESAAELGMVQNAQPASLRLSDGALLGALESSTSEARGNVVPNSTLESMPLVDAEGLLVDRNTGSEPKPSEPPVRWKGALPAPKTH